MFWQSLQVTFEIFCSHGAQVGTNVFLDQINGHFGYISTELIKQKDNLRCLWDILECQQKKLVKGMNYIFISTFCVAPAGLKYASLSLFTMVPSSDNSIVCFRRKAFLKSDMLAGFTTSVALIWYLACVISCKFDFIVIWRTAFSLAFG
jgi:hypothetical protein